MTRRDLFRRTLGALGAAALAPLAKWLPWRYGKADAMTEALCAPLREAWQQTPPPVIGQWVRVRSVAELERDPAMKLGQNDPRREMIAIAAGYYQVAGFDERYGAGSVSLDLRQPGAMGLASTLSLSAPSWRDMERMVQFSSVLQAPPMPRFFLERREPPDGYAPYRGSRPS